MAIPCLLASCALAVFSAPALAQTPTPPVPSFDLVTVLRLVSTHSWLPLAMIVVVYARTAVSDKSKFPVSIPDAWLHVVTAFLGLVFGVLVARQAGAAWGISILGGVVAGGASGLFDGFVSAVFGDPSKAPKWARVLLMIADDATKGGTSQGPYRENAAPPPPPAPKPPVAARLAFVGMLVMSLTGCPQLFNSVSPALDCGTAVAKDALKGMTLAQIFEDVKGECSNDLGQVIAALIAAGTKDPNVAHSAAYTEALKAKATLATMPEPTPEH